MPSWSADSSVQHILISVEPTPISLLPQLQSRLPESLLHFAECVRELLLFLVRSCLLPLLECVAAALEQGWKSCVDSCK